MIHFGYGKNHRQDRTFKGVAMSTSDHSEELPSRKPEIGKQDKKNMWIILARLEALPHFGRRSIVKRSHVILREK